MQSLIEQQDAANEELRSANEEILSSNEELQSTNEELETAKEELQSVNEELTTVNEQLQNRNLELTQANNDLTNLLTSIEIPVVMVGGDLRVRRFTEPAKKVMSLQPSDVGRPIGDIKLLVDVPDLEALIEHVIEAVQMCEREVRDRRERWHELRIYPYRTASDKIDGAVIVLLDIDRRKRAEETLREADRRKDEFLATLSHELRNPLAPLRNAVEILRHADVDPETTAQAREVLDRQLRQLSRIVEDLIDVSRIVEKKIELHRERVAVNAIVDTTLETCRSHIEACQHRLSVSLPSEPLFLDADPTRAVQVLVNLLHNAAKFTRPGGQIRLTVEPARNEHPPLGSAAPGMAILRVTDNGIGIPPELAPHVFEMFTQGERGPGRTRSGLGVGLTLVRSLVQMHGGSVEVHSAGLGQGSEFTVHLPLAADRAAEPVAAVDSKVAAGETDRPGMLSPKRILVVDDSLDQARCLGKLLELRGHEVRLAFDGPAALQKAADFVPDVALVDIGLPGMSGYEVASRLRAQPRLCHVLLVAQTGWGQEEDRQRSQKAGFDYHLVKPVDPETLYEILRMVGTRPE